MDQTELVTGEPQLHGFIREVFEAFPRLEVLSLHRKVLESTIREHRRDGS